MARDKIGERRTRLEGAEKLANLARAGMTPEEIEAEEELLKNTEKVEPIKSGGEPGRNDPCPCGSGKKYKKCCADKA